MEAAEGGNGGGVDTAEGLADERDDLVTLGEAVSVVAGVGGDVALTGGVVEGALGGLPALLGAEDLIEDSGAPRCSRRPGGGPRRRRERRLGGMSRGRVHGGPGRVCRP